MFILHASEVKAWPSYLNPRFTKSYSFKSDSACHPFDVTQLANMQNTCNSITCPHSTSRILFCNLKNNLASQVAQWRRTHLPSRRPKFDPWGGKISWGRKWQLTPVSLPEKCRGQRSLGGYSSWGHNESGTTEWLSSSSSMRVQSETESAALLPCLRMRRKGSNIYWGFATLVALWIT